MTKGTNTTSDSTSPAQASARSGALRRAWKPYRTANGAVKQRMLTMSTTIGSPQPQRPARSSQKASPGTSGNISAILPEARAR
ncbi:MAG: hypothetical protein ABSG78_06635 [Verrucomicrobiota bacterium]